MRKTRDTGVIFSKVVRSTTWFYYVKLRKRAFCACIVPCKGNAQGIQALSFRRQKSFFLFFCMRSCYLFFFAFHRRDTNLFCFSQGVLGISSLVPCPLSLVPCPLSLVPCPLLLEGYSLIVFKEWYLFNDALFMPSFSFCMRKET